MTPTKVQPWTLADGRDELFFVLPNHPCNPVVDRRQLPDRTTTQSELRFDRSTEQWVVIAGLRQERTYKPPPDQCPLCPGPTGLTSEVPAPDYDVVVFENRFASLSAADGSACPLPAPVSDDFVAAPSHGRCEVICFSSDHNSSFADLSFPQARLVVEAWRHRTADLLSRPGIEQVFCFENRGEEIGVTLTHPHGQIYGYPYLTPRTERMLRAAETHRENHGSNLFADIVAQEIAAGSRIVAVNHGFTAFVPFAARWPVEVHIYPNRFVHNLLELENDELDGLTDVYLEILNRLDRLYPTPLPYMAALHQYSDTEAQHEGYFHIEVISTRRSATKLKYLASSESAMEAFISDVVPEDVAAMLRGVGE